MPKEIRALLQRELRLKTSDVYVVEGLLDLGDLWPLAEIRRPSLKRKPFFGVTQPRLVAGKGPGGPTDIFSVLRQGDVLVQHPYDSFSTSVEEFVREAADDPSVLAIKQTLYRTSDEESPIVQSLARAAESGKQVVALVELTARGDEEANIGWAQRLETAGVHVVYGVVGLKTHAKTVLVVREESGAIRRYCHVGTGNYNPVTARIYEDVGLLSADDELTADVADLFNYLTGYSNQRSFRKALVAPAGLRARLIELIREEAEPEGRIVVKVNNLIDPETIDALYEAAQAGAQIDLIVRSMCCLRPGVSGLSESIRVRSIVGRYLEHSRIFRFGSDERGPRYYIGSADLMQRNLDRRVECVAPVTDPALTARLEEILSVALADDVLAWELGIEGWAKVPTGDRDRQPDSARGACGGAREDGAVTPGRERELKLSAPPSLRLPDLDGIADGIAAVQREPVSMLATYFDTDDLRLIRAGVTLRHRTGEGWTVKLPADSNGGLFVRSELTFPGDIRRPVPAAFELVRAYARSAPLAPQARLRTVRRVVELRDGEGVLAAEVCDDEVSVLDGRRVAARFRELEVELRGPGSKELAGRVADALHAAGAGPLEQTPKLVRALGGRAEEPADVAVAAELDETAGALVKQALAASVVRLVEHDPVVRLDTDTEGVHQMRVATRRMRSDLLTFAPFIDADWSAELRAELGWLAGLLGRVRDADVLLARLRERVATLPERARRRRARCSPRSSKSAPSRSPSSSTRCAASATCSCSSASCSQSGSLR